MADPTGRDNAETAGSLPPGVGYVDAPVIRRKAVAMLAALGLFDPRISEPRREGCP
jgi:hypothetical protein